MPFPERLDIPGDVLEITTALEAAGFEAWCVGGAIRDNLLGEPNADFDIATAARPEQVRGLFRHNVPVGEKYGTVAVRSRRRFHEVTTFRRDVKTDGRHAEVEFGVSIDDDLARRDFTINAIAFHPLRLLWRDPFAGADDLAARLIRAVGDPARRFEEDYLRILRALRFAARFDFEIEPATWEAARKAAPGLAHLSAERVRDEWFKGLKTTRSIPRLVELWQEVGAAAVWLPELADPGAVSRLAGCGEGRKEARDPVLLTLLLCRNPAEVLVRLKGSNAEVARVTAAIKGPPEPESADPVAVRRWLAAVGAAADDLEDLWTLRHGVAPIWAPVVGGIRDRGEPLARKDLAVSGDDLRKAGIPAGPAMGSLLEQLLAMVVEDPSLNTRETLLARARALS